MGYVTTNEIVEATKDQTCQKTLLEMVVIDCDASSSTNIVSLVEKMSTTTGPGGKRIKTIVYVVPGETIIAWPQRCRGTGDHPN